VKKENVDEHGFAGRNMLIPLLANIRDTIRSLSRTDMPTFFIISGLSLFVFGFISGMEWAGGFGAAYLAINMSASMFILGVPISLGAALLLRSEQSRTQIRSSSESLVSPRILIISRFVVLFLLGMVVMVLWILYSFSVAIVLYHFVDPSGIIIYLPAAILAGIIVTLLTSGIGILLASFMDEWKLTVLAGVAFFFIVASIFGMGIRLSIYDYMSIFSPYHLFRFLSIVISGYVSDPIFGVVPNDPETMSMIMGMYIGPLDMAVPVVFWVLFTILQMLVSERIHGRNMYRWQLEKKLDSIAGDNDVKGMEEVTTHDAYKALKHSYSMLRGQRLVVVTSLVLILFIFPVVKVSLRSQAQSENTHILYQSSSNGEPLPLGQWRYGVVEVPLPSSGLTNAWQVHVDILDWDGCPEELEAVQLFSKISVETFEAMNDTQRENTCIGWAGSITRDNPYIAGGWTYFDRVGTFLWAFKFRPAPGYEIEGTMTVFITIAVQEMSP
jgi:hypothetical protein